MQLNSFIIEIIIKYVLPLTVNIFQQFSTLLNAYSLIRTKKRDHKKYIKAAKIIGKIS